MGNAATIQENQVMNIPERGTQRLEAMALAVEMEGGWQVADLAKRIVSNPQQQAEIKAAAEEIAKKRLLSQREAMIKEIMEKTAKEKDSEFSLLDPDLPVFSMRGDIDMKAKSKEEVIIPKAKPQGKVEVQAEVPAIKALGFFGKLKFAAYQLIMGTYFVPKGILQWFGKKLGGFLSEVKNNPKASGMSLAILCVSTAVGNYYHFFKVF